MALWLVAQPNADAEADAGEAAPRIEKAVERDLHAAALCPDCGMPCSKP